MPKEVHPQNLARDLELTTKHHEQGHSEIVVVLHHLSAPKSQRIFAICDCDAHRGPEKSQRFPRQEKEMLHCDLRVRWKVASDLRFRAAISEPKTSSFCRISDDLAPSTWKSLAIVRFGCVKFIMFLRH